MKRITLLLTLLIPIVSSSYSQSKQYGIGAVELDNFDFSLDIVSFFPDESVFRGTNKDDLWAAASERYIDRDSIQMGYIHYSTKSARRSRPLASYSGVGFEWLDIVTDEADENVLMAIGTTSYASPQDVIKIIDGLTSEYGSKISIEEQFDGVNIIFYKGDLIANLYIDIEPSNSRDLRNYMTNSFIVFDKAKYNILKSDLERKEDLKCSLFITKEVFDKAIRVAGYYTGNLMNYK